MEQILGQINKTPDVLGSCIVAGDGIIVATDFNSEIDSELIGALISAVIRSAGLAVEKLGFGEIRSFMLEADKNKLFFSRCKFGFVVVLTGADANLGLIRVEVKNAVNRLEGINL